jgi:hypothetical protein
MLKTLVKRVVSIRVVGGRKNQQRSKRKTETVFKNGIGFDSKKIFESIKGKVGMN